MQSSISRHLQEQQYQHSIITSDIFFKSREAIASKCRELKKQGKGNQPQKKRAPTQSEVKQMWDQGAIGCSSPRTLQHSMWWVMSTRFGKRANKENVDKYPMRWGDVSVKKNADGLQYFVANERNTKTRQGDAPNEVKEVIRVYEDREEPAYCPVSMYQLYASKRPKDMCKSESRFYLQPKSFSSKEAMAKEEVWYKKQVYLPQLYITNII